MRTTKHRPSFLRTMPSLCWPAFCLVCLSWIPYLRVFSHGLSFGDEGLIAQSALRITQGQIPFKDFFSAMVPGAYYFYALLFSLFEPSFLVLRLGVMLVAALLLLSVWFVLGRCRVSSFFPYLATACFMAFFGGPAWFIASHHWLSTLFCVVSLALLLPASECLAPSHSAALASGIFSAMAAATLQHRGAVWIIAACAALALLPRGERLKTYLAYLGGVTLCAIPAAGYFIFHAGFDVACYDLITFPMQQYHNFAGHRGTTFKNMLELLENISTAYSFRNQPLGFLRLTTWSMGFAGLTVIYLLPFAGCLALWQLLRTAWFSSYQTGCVAAFFISSYIATLHRLSDTTLIFAASSSIIIIALAIETLQPGYMFIRATRYIWSLFFITIACCYCLLTVLSPKSTQPTPAGSIQLLYSGEAETMSGLATFATQNLHNSSKIFCYPYSPMLYFLFRGTNPTPFDTLTWPMHTTEQMKQTRQLLDNSACRWIIMTGATHDNTGFETYIHQRYIPRQKFKYATILERQ